MDTATRERSLESQLARLGGAEVQAGAQAEQVEHGKDASATSVAEELAHAQAAIEEHKSAASHWMRSCKQVQADAQKQGAELAARNTALRSRRCWYTWGMCGQPAGTRDGATEGA